MSEEKRAERLKMLEKVEQYEKEGRFTEDVAEDPPAPVLEPDQIDYLKKKYSNKFKKMIATGLGELFYANLIRKKQVIVKEINGLENLENVKTGGIIVSNHFNPYECFTVEKTFRASKKGRRHKIYAVIREGNYTNFPGFYGFVFKNAETLPLSSNHKTMKKFYEAVEEILTKKDFILIYPEQSMWWNYRKPKPLQDGAYRFASKHNVPIIPFFITTKESDIIDDAGFPIMEYYIHIEKPIYQDENLTPRQNVQFMKEKNFNIWKKIYESFYGIPLEYTCPDEMLPDYILDSIDTEKKDD